MPSESQCTRCDGYVNNIRETVSSNEHLCNYCYSRRFTNCDGCGAEIHLANDSFRSDNSNTFCVTCYATETRTCGECGINHSIADLHTVDLQEWCSHCYSNNFNECDDCGGGYNNDILVEGRCMDCRGSTTWDNHGFFVESPSVVELKSDRKFGIEIETSACPGHITIRQETVFGCKPDGSVDGMEFVSPILYGDEGLAEVRTICDHARRLNWEIDSSCGLHLHVDLTGVPDEKCFKLAYAYMHTYNFWTSFISDARKRNYYCAEHTYTDADILRYNGFDEWCHFASNGRRYDWCNWYAWLQHKTVELRHHTATLNGNKICNWIKAHTRFIDKVLDMPQVTLTRALAGRGSHAQFEAISGWWDDDELTTYYNERAARFHKPFRAVSLVGA